VDYDRAVPVQVAYRGAQLVRELEPVLCPGHPVGDEVVEVLAADELVHEREGAEGAADVRPVESNDIGMP